MQNLLRDILIQHVPIDGTNYVLAAGTSDVNSSAIDAANYRELTFIITLGVMATSSTVDAKIQGSADGSTGWTDIAGTANTQAIATDDDKMIGWCIAVPSAYRYYRVAFTRGDSGNSTIECLHAILSKGRKKSVTQLVTAGQFIAQPEHSLSPQSGTA